MKVKELLTRLENLNPESDVLCSFERTDVSGLGPKLLEINDILECEAEKSRDESGVPRLKFQNSDLSTLHVLIDVTDDF